MLQLKLRFSIEHLLSFSAHLWPSLAAAVVLT